MLIRLIFDNPIVFLILLVALLAAITIHEAAHAFASSKLGDQTAKMLGRLSLNPAAHLDPIGTLFLLFFGFGWGKPVPVNPQNFKNPVFDELKVSLAGPLSNFLLAAFLSGILRIPNLPGLLISALSLIIFLNLILMIFNLLPIPPLDGSKFLKIFVSEQVFLIIQQYGLWILLGLLFLSYLGIPLIPFLLQRVVGGLFILLTGRGIPLF